MQGKHDDAADEAMPDGPRMTSVLSEDDEKGEEKSPDDIPQNMLDCQGHTYRTS
jgi:hypothetical protein